MTTTVSAQQSAQQEGLLVSDTNYLILRAALTKYEKRPTELNEQELADIKKHVIKEIEIQRLVLSSDEACEVVVPDAVVVDAYQKIRDRYETQKEFQQDLAANGIEGDGLRSALARELKVEAVLDRVGARSVNISDMDIMIYYHMHKDKFKQSETRTASHILITINDEYEENTREAARERINIILKRVRKNPKRFSQQAMKNSECPTALRGGRLGSLEKGTLYPELDEVLFSMKPGDISDCVESPSGFHLLYCEAIRPAGPVSLKEAQAGIKELLQRRAQRMCQKAWLSELVKSKKAQGGPQ